jgi:hypothetical protein
MESIDDISPQQWDTISKQMTSDWKKQLKEAANKIAPEEEPSKDYQPIKPYKLPTDAQTRKTVPIYSGFVKYFPRAMAEVSRISLIGGVQHGQTPQTLHWDRPKSGDELDAMMRHIIDQDWAQVAWRAMANLEKYLEREELN